MEKTTTTTTTIALVLVIVLVIMALTANIYADRDNNPHNGNNGQCRKLQSSFPEELQDYQGCHDTFTGQGHNDPIPLP